MSIREAQAGGEAEEVSHTVAAAVFMVLPALLLAAAVHRVAVRSVAAVQH
ncbi:MAG: hypothetical protein JNM45_05680 [Rhizobiales bacterium]|nr:hypothetical protein [Hyphomicrobiales bacterium]